MPVTDLSKREFRLLHAAVGRKGGLVRTSHSAVIYDRLTSLGLLKYGKITAAGEQLLTDKTTTDQPPATT